MAEQPKESFRKGTHYPPRNEASRPSYGGEDMSAALEVTSGPIYRHGRGGVELAASEAHWQGGDGYCDGWEPATPEVSEARA